MFCPWQNYTTWLFESSFEVRGTGFFWSVIENNFGAEIKEQIRDLKMTKDKMVRMLDLMTVKPNQIGRIATKFKCRLFLATMS